jgi:Asp-tRNA(Asn)/Glu-tRNA(Gln) amidotransferase A subunit family amidase
MTILCELFGVYRTLWANPELRAKVGILGADRGGQGDAARLGNRSSAHRTRCHAHAARSPPSAHPPPHSSPHRQMHDDTRIILACASRLLASHYLQGLRARCRGATHMARAFEGCDLIATPATACVAPAFARGAETTGEATARRARPGWGFSSYIAAARCMLQRPGRHPGVEALAGCATPLPCLPPPCNPPSLGSLHLPTTSKLSRFAGVANILGLPAVVVPVGSIEPEGSGGGPGARGGSSGGEGKLGKRKLGKGKQAPAMPAALLPVALQLMGPPWHDASVLRAGCLLEAALRAGGAAPLLPRRRARNPLAPPPAGAEDGAVLAAAS